LHLYKLIKFFINIFLFKNILFLIKTLCAILSQYSFLDLLPTPKVFIMVTSIQISTPSTSPIQPTTFFVQCITCKKTFKSKRGLIQHETFVRKYNITHDNLYELPEEFINDFKKTLIFLIHHQLPNHFTKIGKKSLTVACTESQFFSTFNGYIHYYSKKTRFYKCIFGGEDASTKLAQIFNDENWGIKFYHGNECTLVLTKLDNMDEEENPLALKRKLIIKSSKKPKYKRGEIIVEWKPKKEKDVKGNECEGGFLHMHFWIAKRRIY
jgi:hypothetical protein